MHPSAFTIFTGTDFNYVTGNRVLWRIFVTKREELAGGWKRLHIEEDHKLYASTNIIRVIKSRKIRWACSTHGT